MDGAVNEMGGPRYQWPSQNEQFVPTYNEVIPYFPHASQSEAHHADECVDLSLTGKRTEDRHLTHNQHGQHGELESYSSQNVLREAAYFHIGSFQEDAVFAIGRFDTGCGTTVPNPPWSQEGKFPHQQPSPFYPHRQPEADVGSSSHRQYRNGSNDNFIADPSVSANNDPWSTYNTLDASRDTHHPTQMELVAGQNALNATYPMFAHDDPDSIRPTHNGLEKPMSNRLPEYCPYSFQLSAPMCQMNISTSSCPTSSKSPLRHTHAPVAQPSPRYERENKAGRVSSLSKTGGLHDNHLSRQGRLLAPPMQRRVSSASSQTTEATSSSAISDNSPEVSMCPVDSCGVTFSGKFRRGNHRRHMRTLHEKQGTIECRICGRKFGRSDALHKHSRKQHS